MSETVGTGENGRSLVDISYAALLRAIIGKELAAGERLVEVKVAKSLGVSITPLRQAFMKLAQQGLLVIYPYKGTYVSVPTREYAKDTYFMREKIEMAAVELSFESLTKESADTLLDMCKCSEYAFLKGNIYECVNYDVGFHSYFITKAASPTLTEVWEMMKNRIAFIQSYTKPIKLEGSRLNMMERHHYVIDAIRKGDKQFCIAAIAEHIRSTKFRCLPAAG